MTSANNIQTCTITCYCNHTCEQRQFRCLSRERLLQATKSQSNFLFYTAQFHFFFKYFITNFERTRFLLKFSNPHEPNFYLHSIYFFSFQFLLDQIFLNCIILTVLFLPTVHALSKSIIIHSTNEFAHQSFILLRTL